MGTRITGFLIFVLCIIGAIAIMLLSISHNVSNLNTLTLANVAYIFTIVFSCLAVFTGNCFLTAIKIRYYVHYTKMVLLRNGLLIFVVYNNYSYFLSAMHVDTIVSKIMYLLLAILMDFGVMTLLPFSFDRMTKTYTYKESSIKGTGIKDLVKMYLFNKTFKLTSNVLSEYNHNIKSLNFVTDKDTIEVKEVNPDVLQLTESVSNDGLDKETAEDCEITEKVDNENVYDLVQYRDVEYLKKLILENSKDNVCPSIAKLMSLSRFTRNRIITLKKRLQEENFIETRGKNTYVCNSGV